jgi:DNA uptake protein ComE-like DNA-binding protein
MGSGGEVGAVSPTPTTVVATPTTVVATPTTVVGTTSVTTTPVTTTPVTTTTVTTTTVTTTSTAVVTTTTQMPTVAGIGAADSVKSVALLAELAVVDEPPRVGYERRLFPHWQDVNGSGCTTRQDMLLATVIGFPQVDLFDRCVIVEGDWFSVYDGELHQGGPGEVDVDHVVALAEAWDSGAWSWDEPLRRRFANDPDNLLVVTASSNRSKGDRDVGEWKPPRREAWCVTASIVVEVKHRYRLSVDPAEARALRTMLGTCTQSGVTTVAPPAPLTPSTVASPRVAEGGVATSEVCVDVNTASLDQLQRLVHIGAQRAQQIVSLRPFRSVDELIRVSGIGPARLRDIVAQGLVCP